MERLMTLKTSIGARSFVTSSAPTRKSLLVILFTILTTVDSLPPSSMSHSGRRARVPAADVAELLLLLGVKYKMPDEGDREAILSS